MTRPGFRAALDALTGDAQLEVIDRALYDLCELRVEVLRAMPYREYLGTLHWAERRRWALERARHRCAVCNARGFDPDVTLQVHHRTYKRLGCERVDDLTVLCDDCHAAHHDRDQAA